LALTEPERKALFEVLVVILLLMLKMEWPAILN